MGLGKTHELKIQVAVVVICLAVFAGLLGVFEEVLTSPVANAVLYLLWALCAAALTLIILRSKKKALSKSQVLILCISGVIGAFLAWFCGKDAYTIASESGANPFVAIWLNGVILVASFLVPMLSVIIVGTRRLPNSIMTFAIRFLIVIALLPFLLILEALALSLFPQNTQILYFFDPFFMRLVFGLGVYFIVYSFVNDSREIFVPNIKTLVEVEDEN